MATYQWQGRTRSGEPRTGILVADSQAAATAQLRQQMIMPMSIRPKLKELREYLPFLESRIKIKQVVVFTRQFATMIDAGLPLVQCLTILASQQEKGIFKRTLTEVKADVESGSTFSEALAKHPKAFDRLYTSLVESGETGGILDTILTRLANYLEKAEALRRKLLDLYHSWGYQLVMPPLLEFTESLLVGLGADLDQTDHRHQPTQEPEPTHARVARCGRAERQPRGQCQQRRAGRRHPE